MLNRFNRLRLPGKRKPVFVPRAVLVWLCLLYGCSIWAQHKKEADSSIHPPVIQSSLVSDDSLLKRVEDIHATLDHIASITDHGLDTRDMEQALPDVTNNLDVIKENLTLYSRVQNPRNLQMFRVLLGDMQAQLNEWRSSLFSYNSRLLAMHAKMESYTKDTLLRQLYNDTLFKRLYQAELDDMKTKWKAATLSTSADLSRINELQAKVSSAYFNSVELQQLIRTQLRQSGKQLLGKEYPYLWNLQQDVADTGTYALARKSYRSQKRILQYYFRQNNESGGWMLLASVLFFTWVFRNYRKLRHASYNLSTSGYPFEYLKPVPLLGTLVVLFNLAPFFDLNPPYVYIEIIQFLLLIVLTVFFWRNWPQRLFVYWLAIAGLYLFFVFTHLVVTPGILLRIELLVLNLVAPVFGFYLYRNLHRKLPLKRFIRAITGIYIALNLLAVLCNLLGRVSLARTFGITSILGLTQMVALIVFVQLFTEAFYLQMLCSRLGGGVKASFNYEKIERGLKRILSFIVVVCWLIVFTTNLNIYTLFYNLGNRLLNKPWHIGSTSFTIGHVLLFFAIIYLANLLQKYVGYFLGETDDDFVGEIKKKGSRLAILRLLVLLLGFLLAIAASGLPVDKITVVLGALGVGIGLGLQSIVHNLVSGIILIFEKPLQLGDFIELGNQKGKVRDIGIRSSRIVTQEGAEVVVPNGDLLSGRLINWTLTNNHIRIELLFTIQPVDQLATARKIMLEELEHAEEVVARLPKDVFVTSINDNSAQLQVQCWLMQVHREQEMRSQLLMGIYEKLRQQGIAVV